MIEVHTVLVCNAYLEPFGGRNVGIVADGVRSALVRSIAKDKGWTHRSSTDIDFCPGCQPKDT